MTDEDSRDDGAATGARPSGRERLRSAAGRARRASRELDGSEGVLSAVKRLRGVLPGDAHFGDPLSLGGTRHAEAAGRTVVGLTERPGVFREIGLGGLQVWQSVLERFGAGSGEHEVTLVNTAARLGDAGKAGEILVSGDLLERLDQDALEVRRRRRGLNLKGAPDDLTVWAVEPR